MKRTLATVGIVLACVVGWAIAVALVMVPLQHPNFVPGDPLWLRLWWEIGPFLITLVLAIILLRALRLRLPLGRKPGLAVIGGLVLGTVWIACAVGILFVTHSISFDGQGTIVAVPQFLGYLFALLINTMTQELLVHGILWAILASRHGKVVALIGTTMVFVLLHPGAFEAGAIAVLSVLTAGFLFSLLTGWFGGICTAISAHFAWNAIGGLYLGAVVLGDPYSVLTVNFNRQLLAGLPGVGIESGVVVLIANIVFCIGLGLLMLRAARRSANTAAARLCARGS